MEGIVGLTKRFLWRCRECGDVFTCSGDCLVSRRGKACICHRCLAHFSKRCKARRISNPSKILLAKLGKGVWIGEEEKIPF